VVTEMWFRNVELVITEVTRAHELKTNTLIRIIFWPNPVSLLIINGTTLHSNLEALKTNVFEVSVSKKHYNLVEIMRRMLGVSSLILLSSFNSVDVHCFILLIEDIFLFSLLD
jgi:hypothetical protein